MKVLALSTGTLLGMCVSFAHAQTQLSAGYTYLNGDNKTGGESFESVDSGRGVALEVMHHWGDFYVAGRHESLKLANRNIVEVSRGPLFPAYDFEYDYDDRYKTYQIKLGWEKDLTQRHGIWLEAGISRERWSNNGGTLLPIEGPSPEGIDPIASVRTNHTAAVFGVGYMFKLTPRSIFSAGLGYQNKTYYAVPHHLNAGGADSSDSSLVEAKFKFLQKLTDRFGAYIQYQPSDVRQLATIGLIYDF